MSTDDQLTIRIDRDKLLDSLRRNQYNHTKEFAKAKTAWHARMCDLNDSLHALLLVKDNNTRSHKLRELTTKFHQVVFSQPTLETKRYDTIIAMVEAHTEASLELTQQQFDAYVQDNWEWKQDWHTATSAYLSSSR